MKTAAFPTIGTLDTTLPTVGTATYQSESLALDIHQIIKNLSDAGFQFQMAEPLDVTTLESDLRAFGDTFDTWIESAAVASTAGLPVPANPALPDFAAAIGMLLAGGWGAIIPILINLAVDLVVRWIERKLDPDTNLNELVAAVQDFAERLVTEGESGILEELSDRLENADSIGIADILEKAFIDVNPASERYSLMWNIARQAIRVVVASATDLDDVLLEDI